MSADDKRRPRNLSDAERSLWSRFTRSVAPLRPRPVPADRCSRHAAQQGETCRLPAPPRGAQRRAAAEAAPGLEPLDRRFKQRLARGTKAIDARLDLHGKTQDQAHALLCVSCAGRRPTARKVALIITGKGTRARDDRSERGVLKRQVPQWLRLPEFRAYVIGFEHAHVGHGGEGALYVRIRRSTT